MTSKMKQFFSNNKNSLHLPASQQGPESATTSSKDREKDIDGNAAVRSSKSQTVNIESGGKQTKSSPLKATNKYSFIVTNDESKGGVTMTRAQYVSTIAKQSEAASPTDMTQQEDSRVAAKKHYNLSISKSGRHRLFNRQQTSIITGELFEQREVEAERRMLYSSKSYPPSSSAAVSASSIPAYPSTGQPSLSNPSSTPSHRMPSDVTDNVYKSTAI